MRCKDRYHACLAGCAKPTRIPFIDNHASGKNHFAVVLCDGHRELVPMEEIATDRMSPAHMAPCVPFRVVLIEEVILAVEVNKAVRVVCPVVLRRKVNPRPILLIVG